MSFKRWMSIVMISIILSCSILSFPAQAEEHVSFDDYVMSHHEQYESRMDVLPKGNRLFTANSSDKENISLEDDGTSRYSVLALDCSGSMYGTPMSYAQQAAVKFCQQLFEKGSSSNYVAIVRFTGSASLVCDFTNDLSKLTTAINSLYANGGTSQHSALKAADDVLSVISEKNTILNVVLLSDGLPESGAYSYTGHYSSEDYLDYEYANAAFELASTMKSKYKIYTLGFFHNISGRNLEFGRRFMEDLSNAGYYEVQNPEDLEFEFGKIAHDIIDKKGQFKYEGAFNEKYDTTGDYYYSDNYFRHSSQTYNPSLATMSLCLALSVSTREATNGKWIKEERSRNIQAILGKDGGIGFEDIELSDDWEYEPTANSIGVVAAHKMLDGQPLIALVVRGFGYYGEWGGNFQLGYSGEHEGWKIAKNKVLCFLNDYTNRHSLSGNVKLWIIGYSRGGAVANLTAGTINTAGGKIIAKYDDKEIEEAKIKVNYSDLYCYVFEPPMGAMTEDVKVERKYGMINGEYRANIHNIVNINDIVPRVAMRKWNFARYGRDHYLPNISTKGYDEAKDKMFEQLRKLYADKVPEDGMVERDKLYYRVPDYSWLTSMDIEIGWPSLKITPDWTPEISINIDTKKRYISNSELLDRVVDRLTEKGFVSRNNYVKGVQNNVVDILHYVMSENGADKALWRLKQFYNMFLYSLAGEDGKYSPLMKIIRPYFCPFYPKTVKETLVKARFVDVIIEAMILADIPEVLPNYRELLGDLSEFLGALLRTIWTEDDEYHSVTEIVALINNLFGSGNFIQSHVGDFSFVWVQSEDPNYTDHAETISEMPQVIRVIRINCPVDVTVVDRDTRETVAKIESDKATTNSEAISSFINAQGEKIIQVPGDGNYEIEIEATGKGEMNYQISEYHLTSGETTLLQNYYRIPISANDALTGYVPAISAVEYNENALGGTNTPYTLIGDDGKEIKPSDRATGDDIHYYQVKVESNNECGFVYGSGEFINGSFADIYAMPVEGGRFLGWYIGSEKVSDEADYRFAVRKDTTVTAKFSEVPLYEVKFASSGSGRVENVDIRCAAGTQVMLSAIPDEGARFVRWETSSGQKIISNDTDSNATLMMPSNDVQVTAVFSGGPISIEQQPKDQYVVVGQRAIFKIDASGNDLSYQWYINRNGGKGWVPIDGAIGAEYITSVVELSNDGYQYKCIIHDSDGNEMESTIAVLHVKAPSDIPETGDSSKPVLWSLMIGLGLAGILFERRRKVTK